MSYVSRVSVTVSASETTICDTAVGKYTSSVLPLMSELAGAGAQLGTGDGFLAAAGGLGERSVAM